MEQQIKQKDSYIKEQMVQIVQIEVLKANQEKQESMKIYFGMAIFVLLLTNLLMIFNYF